MHTYTRPILGLSAIRSEGFLEYFGEYQKQLAEAGYCEIVARLHLHSVAHFGVWLERERIGLETVDDETVAQFSRHREDCGCPGTSSNHGRHVDSYVRVFVRYLRSRGAVRARESCKVDDLVRGFLDWMRAHRGVVDRTLVSYERYVAGVVDFLGDKPQAYTAGGLRDFVCERYRHYGRHSVRMVLAAVRMFLRYLAINGRCRPGLEQALVAPANWARSSLPRGLRHD
jgi:integrase/recombinase XerD